MKTILTVIAALTVAAYAQAPVVKKGSSGQPTEQSSPEQTTPVVKKGTAQPTSPQESSTPVVKKGTQPEQTAQVPTVKKGPDTAAAKKPATKGKKKSRKKRAAQSATQP
ncbi:MAG: hypothetical protein RMK00_08885 [Bacteroidota bacterium]|nr:hypothetical protein [Chlorobiota bacterium]MDW8075868.1 hypothetical protein [Bacteroidota bacterium]